MNRNAAHSKLVNEILLALSADGVLCWDNPTGVAFRCRAVISYGLPGSPDILAIVGPFGRFLGVEVKSGKGCLSRAQKRFRDAAIARGGVYIVARSVQDVLDAVAQIRNLEQEVAA